MPLDPRRIEVMDDRVAEIMRRLTLDQKLKMLDDMRQFAWTVSEAGVRHFHPEWSDGQVRTETLRRVSRGAF